MKSQVLHTVWCCISGEAAGEIGNCFICSLQDLGPVPHMRTHVYPGRRLINRNCAVQRIHSSSMRAAITKLELSRIFERTDSVAERSGMVDRNPQWSTRTRRSWVRFPRLAVIGRFFLIPGGNSDRSFLWARLLSMSTPPSLAEFAMYE